jgi:hypothetical protein
MDLTLRERYFVSFHMKLIVVIITAVSFITLFVNWFNNTLLPLLRQFFLIENRMNNFLFLCIASYCVYHFTSILE